MLRIALFPIGFILAGCGAIINGTSTNVPVDSDPQGVEVWVDDAKAGVTPLHVRLDNASEHTVVFKRPGHPDQAIKVRRKVASGYIVLDVLFTGLLGIVIDAATGGWYTPDPASINVLPPDGVTRVAEPAIATTPVAEPAAVTPPSGEAK